MGVITIKVTCPHCEGIGYPTRNQNNVPLPCPICKGNGSIFKKVKHYEKQF